MFFTKKLQQEFAELKQRLCKAETKIHLQDRYIKKLEFKLTKPNKFYIGDKISHKVFDERNTYNEFFIIELQIVDTCKDSNPIDKTQDNIFYYSYKVLNSNKRNFIDISEDELIKKMKELNLME